jgi:exodeoxyribonuclease VII small subunit
MSNEAEPSYEEMLSELQQILKRIDDGSTPIDGLAKDVKRGTTLIKKLDQKLKHIETEVRDAFAELETLEE